MDGWIETEAGLRDCLGQSKSAMINKYNLQIKALVILRQVKYTDSTTPK